MDESTGNVTLEEFAARVGCHFTTASRLRAGERMPGRELLGRIVVEFGLNPTEAFQTYTQEDPAKFGAFLREHVFSARSKEEAENAGSNCAAEAA